MYTYFGSDAFSLEILKGLSQIKRPNAIVTQPDRPSGRKQQLKPGPLAIFAKENEIRLHQPENLKSPELQAPLLKDQSSLFIVVSFGQILPQSFLDQCPTIINGHASLLPKYRGASPIQSVILNGEKESGMTIMHIVKALDAGPMISKKAFPLSLTETHESLSQKLIDDGIEMLTPFITGTPVPEGEEQDHSAATHCGKLHKADTKLNPGKTDAFACDRIIRAFSPSPGAILRINTPKGEKQFKIIEAIPRNDGPDAGHFLIDNQQISLGCQDNTHLDLKIVQMEGKPAMATADFLRGFRGELELSQN